MLLRLAYLGITNAFALPRLLLDDWLETHRRLLDTE
jgi:hypothetical protein